MPIAKPKPSHELVAQEVCDNCQSILYSDGKCSYCEYLRGLSVEEAHEVVYGIDTREVVRPLNVIRAADLIAKDIPISARRVRRRKSIRRLDRIAQREQFARIKSDYTSGVKARYENAGEREYKMLAHTPRAILENETKREAFEYLVLEMLRDEAMRLVEHYETQHALDYYRQTGAYREREVMLYFFMKQIIVKSFEFSESDANEIALPSDVRAIINKYAEYSKLTRTFAYLICLDFMRDESESTTDVMFFDNGRLIADIESAEEAADFDTSRLDEELERQIENAKTDINFLKVVLDEKKVSKKWSQEIGYTSIVINDQEIERKHFRRWKLN